MSKHTKGPWSLKHEPEWQCPTVYKIVDSEGKDVIAAFGHYGYEAGVEARIEDLRLAAAAPEMFELLNGHCPYHESSYNEPCGRCDWCKKRDAVLEYIKYIKGEIDDKA